MSEKKVLIKYTNRDFNSIKADLEEHARRYYPDTFKDFSENSFGSYVLDTVSYVGDMLSFYLDYQVNESFIETAVEYDNVRRLARQYGYKYSGRPAAFGIASFYVIVPANSSGLGPDQQYIPMLKTGTEVRSDTGTTFVLTEDVDFNNPKNEVVAARFSDVSGKPTSYAIRAQGQIKSTVLFRTTSTIGEYTKFRRVRIGDGNISEIQSVIDSEGHEYFEVDHLSQDVVYVETTNPNARTDGVRSIMKPKIVPRRFVVDQDSTGTYLQFGYGSDIEKTTTTDVTDPSQVALKMSGKAFITDTAFDPTKLLDSNTLGVTPSNTTLTILFYKNETDSVNAAVGAINSISVSSMTFPNAINNILSTENTVRSSLEVSNELPIVGNTSLPTSEEIKYRSYAVYASQNRTVTRNDYEAYMYMMPSKFGSIKRATVVNDPSSTNRRLSVYIVSEDSSGNLTLTNSTVKENLKVWLNKNKMLNDNIDIYNGKILNIGFDYEAIVKPTHDKIEVLNTVNERLATELSDKMYIGEPFYITKVYNIINKVDGVVDTKNVRVYLKTGTNYNTAPVSIEQLKSNDGTFLKAPKNVVFEIKNFTTDIRGIAT
tara:strand:+ start:901 stop:2697 length:1797 start_codon:yes stop_codon:yes gene_type:complete